MAVRVGVDADRVADVGERGILEPGPPASPSFDAGGLLIAAALLVEYGCLVLGGSLRHAADLKGGPASPGTGGLATSGSTARAAL